MNRDAMAAMSLVGYPLRCVWSDEEGRRKKKSEKLVLGPALGLVLAWASEWRLRDEWAAQAFANTSSPFKKKSTGSQ
jgi:hypothetical protein